MAMELPLELGCQLFGTFLGYLIVRAMSLTGPGLLTWELFTLVMGFEIVRSIVVAILEGHDSNHKSYVNTVPKDPNTFLVGPEFHAMHHVDPSAYISSSFRIFDWFLGTSYTLRSRRITMTGASGAFGTAMKKVLETESVSSIQELKFGLDWNYDNYSSCIEGLTNTDILILAHGSKDEDSMKANHDSAITLIELFKKHRKAKPGSLLLPEVWYVGSELEFQPTWSSTETEAYAKSKMMFARHARKYYDSKEFIYRHIVAAAFDSRMGKAVIGPEWAVSCALWWIRRGARYVPASYTGLAFLNYFDFLYRIEKAP